MINTFKAIAFSLFVTTFLTANSLALSAEMNASNPALATVYHYNQHELNITFPGQYRVNFYSVDNDKAQEDQQNAARFRMRQNIDITFSKRLKSSVRFQLNHTNDNITNAKDNNGNDLQVRHAVIDYRLDSYTHLKAGLVPVLEYQNDLLYSKSWGYNPFALEGFSEFDDLTIHYFAASLYEGSEANASDDKLHYQADFIYTFANKSRVIGSATVMDLNNGGVRGFHTNYALKAELSLGETMHLNAIAMRSITDKSLLGSLSDASGEAYLLQFEKKFTSGNFALLATHATGTSDGRGFLVPMSFTGTSSYWGYTGVLTVINQTDTGFDGDSVHISNNGYGMTSLQAKLEFSTSAKNTLYFSAGWFGNTKAVRRNSTIGKEVLVMNKYAFDAYLSLHLGISHAELFDSLSGYGAGLISGANFNNTLGETRYKTAFFGRLQLEF